ncbi:MAG TPA: PDZ domain-containing protein, partial [Gemmatimonadaceae bacterium]
VRARTAPAAGGGGFGGRGVYEAPVAVARAMPTGILGAQINDLDEDGRKSLFNGSNGVMVMRVIKGSPAERVGLKSGDLITTVEDVKIETYAQLQREMVMRRMNASTKIVVLRAGKTQTLVYEPR